MRIIVFVAALLSVQPVWATELPSEVRGDFVYPQEPDACKYQNYALTIGVSTIEANEFSCKVNRVSPQGKGLSVNVTCSSEDGKSTKNKSLKVEGKALIFDNVSYVRCGNTNQASGAAADTANPSSQTVPIEDPQVAPAPPKGELGKTLPSVCRDDNLKGRPKPIYIDAALKRPSKDYDSAGTGFLPQQSIIAGIHPAYLGTIFSLRTGRDYPGQFYINTNEWGGLCQ